MLLSTITCSRPECTNQLGTDASMWETIRTAAEAGWMIDEMNEQYWCPGHNPAAKASEVWAVGCWVCDWEDESDDDPITSEEQAKKVAMEHQCEPDTWIYSPAQLARKAARREEYELARQVRLREEEVAKTAAEYAAADAIARQKQIEGWARRWLTLRNAVIFWRREHMEGME